MIRHVKEMRVYHYKFIKIQEGYSFVPISHYIWNSIAALS